MSLNFNAREIFEIGVNIEKNGQAFYTAAMEAAKDSATKKFLGELAEWESTHVQIFQNLADALPPHATESTTYDPNGELAMYLKATADTHVFGPGADGAKIAAMCKTARDVIRTALEFEKDSIVFYSAMRKAVSPELGQAEVDRLIEEELKHIVMLSKKLVGLA
jgi:rubrerythrin